MLILEDISNWFNQKKIVQNEYKSCILKTDRIVKTISYNPTSKSKKPKNNLERS